MFILLVFLSGLLSFFGGVYFEQRRLEKKKVVLAKLTPKQKLKLIKDQVSKPKKK